MFCRREVHRISPEKIIEINQFFHEYVMPIQLKNGATLIGRWITEEENEIVTMWNYPSYDEYLKIEERVKKDKLHKQAQAQLLKLGKLFLDYRQEFLTSTGVYHSPKQTVTVSGYITNENGEALLVQTYWRSDTWELPGGGVDDGETLDAALCREIFEETGINVKLFGVTGVYSNGSTLSIVFHGKRIGGDVMTSNETKDVRFVKLDELNVHQYITRGKFLPRVLDAMKGNSIPYESFTVRPYKLLERLEGIVIQDES
ncbi:NUDIX domain-containing protein [Niallia endozanthoxylica]|uniref:NUDIX domain-containing protein n=1 Tax=Niallia endozanthoxylica TaxID=2036016 RepID=A0A5J5HZK9_9BACI|nr:NUDIX domain-containing protein [Niallia endozanthoxylica]KAA9028531.1 NUDIX domain-containing protein [Niallia endozanthoxylica]